ncbi:MAG: hypothetical protein IJ861_00450 [Clostridia bacterium]|nr:hypothetical protein [Clostridia bacterium]
MKRKYSLFLIIILLLSVGCFTSCSAEEDITELSIDTSFVSSSMTDVEESVTVQAVAVGGIAPYRYEYEYNTTEGEHITAVETDTDSCMLKMPDSPCVCYIILTVTDSSGESAQKEFEVTVKSASGKPLEDSGSKIVSERISSGRDITVIPAFTGGTAPYSYNYELISDGNAKALNESPVKTSDFSFQAPVETGGKTLRITAVDCDGNECVKYSDFTVKSVVDVQTPYTSEQVYKDIDQLVQNYPDLIKQYTIGQSEQGKDIPLITLGSGEKKACIVAGIHSREHVSITFTMKCIEEYAAALSNNRKYGEYDLNELFSEYTLYIVPMCNPDGTDISTAGALPFEGIGTPDKDEYKLNANGVNLNRNFPFCWNAQYYDQEAKPGDSVYAGTYGGSEKETQAIIRLCAENDFEWLLDMHIVGNGIYWRDSKNGIIPGDAKLTKALAGRCGYRIFLKTTNPSEYSGGLENWFRAVYNKPALCIELISPEQSNQIKSYINYNLYFTLAVNWEYTKYTYLEAISCSLR